MIPELGHLALVLALILAVLTVLVPLWGSWRGNYAALRLAPDLALSVASRTAA